MHLHQTAGASQQKTLPFRQCKQSNVKALRSKRVGKRENNGRNLGVRTCAVKEQVYSSTDLLWYDQLCLLMHVVISNYSENLLWSDCTYVTVKTFWDGKDATGVWKYKIRWVVAEHLLCKLVWELFLLKRSIIHLLVTVGRLAIPVKESPWLYRFLSPCDKCQKNSWLYSWFTIFILPVRM